MYNLDHFINKFEAIPDHLWTTGVFTDPINTSCHCALGHCGARTVRGLSHFTDEAKALVRILDPVNYWIGNTYKINDAGTTVFSQPTPRGRILAALYNIKNMREVNKNEV